MTASLADIVLPHADHRGLAERLARFYADVDGAIAAHAPVCRNRGDCCRFGTFGHKLYVTTVELAYFIHGTRVHGCAPRDTPQSAIRNPQSAIGTACPYQVEGRCTARPHRPLGCRIFFCDPDSQAWQGPECERRLGQLRRIGAEFGIRYRYIEWLSALSSLRPGKPVKESPAPTGLT